MISFTNLNEIAEAVLALPGKHEAVEASDMRRKREYAAHCAGAREAVARAAGVRPCRVNGMNVHEFNW